MKIQGEGIEWNTNFNDDICVLILCIVENLCLFSILFRYSTFFEKTFELSNVFLKFFSTIFIFRMICIRRCFIFNEENFLSIFSFEIVCLPFNFRTFSIDIVSTNFKSLLINCSFNKVSFSNCLKRTNDSHKDFG